METNIVFLVVAIIVIASVITKSFFKPVTQIEKVGNGFLVSLLLPVSIISSCGFGVWLVPEYWPEAVLVIVMSFVIPYIEYREKNEAGFKERISW